MIKLCNFRNRAVCALCAVFCVCVCVCKINCDITTEGDLSLRLPPFVCVFVKIT